MISWGFADMEASHLTFREYSEDGDRRIKWDKLYIVTLQNWGVIGFSDGNPI